MTSNNDSDMEWSETMSLESDDDGVPSPPLARCPDCHALLESRNKRAHRKLCVSFNTFRRTTRKARIEYKVAAILAHRRRNASLQFQVQWAGTNDVTWEPMAHLVDKDTVNGCWKDYVVNHRELVYLLSQ